MKKCIFCLITDESKFNTKEHILPESLGGGDWAILPSGLFCDNCQNIFGSTIEQQALADYPLVNFRTIMGIPTKKQRAPWFKYWQGTLISGGKPGSIIYEPNEVFKSSYESGQKKHTIIPLVTKKPDMLLRTLLKIGIETIGSNDNKLVFEERFNPARKYALKGIKDFPWFYIQKEDNELLNKYLKEDWDDYHCFMDVHYEDNGLVFLHFRLYYLEFIVPLVENVILEQNYKFNEPKERIVIV